MKKSIKEVDKRSRNFCFVLISKVARVDVTSILRKKNQKGSLSGVKFVFVTVGQLSKESDSLILDITGMLKKKFGFKIYKKCTICSFFQF